MGAVISHIMENGEERPIAFASRTLTATERNCPQIEREALAIVLHKLYYCTLALSSCEIYDYVMVLIWNLAWDMPMNDRKGNEYHGINNTIDKHLTSLKVKIYFFLL